MESQVTEAQLSFYAQPCFVEVVRSPSAVSSRLTKKHEIAVIRPHRIRQRRCEDVLRFLGERNGPRVVVLGFAEADNAARDVDLAQGQAAYFGPS